MKQSIVHALSAYDTATGWIDRGVQLVIAVAMLGMFGLLLLSVASRYVINRPFFWLAEGASYLMALVGLWGSSTCVRHAGHMQVNILQDQFRKRGEIASRVLSPIFVIIVNALLIYYCYVLLIRAGYAFADFGRIEYSPSGFFIVFWPRLSVPTGGLLIALQSLNVIGRAIRKVLVADAPEPPAETVV